MTEKVIEEVIRAIFADNWLIATIIFIVAIMLIRLCIKAILPRFFKACALIITIIIAMYVESFFLQGNKYAALNLSVCHFRTVLMFLLVLTFAFFYTMYRKIDLQLKLVIENTEPSGNKITAWNELQKISIERLAPWQKKKYDKRRLYIRVFLGNMSGAELELEKYKDDKPFYHYMRAVILNFKGNHKEELEEVKLAEDACNGDTGLILHFQILVNRGVAYVGIAEYSLAQDCFKKAIDYGNENDISAPDLWLNIYYNYIFNQTRLHPEISVQECLDILEEVKDHIDIEDPKQYIDYSNIVIDILRQKKADRERINEVINQDFEYLVNSNLTEMEKCILEATTARMICTGRLNPDFVTEKLTKDVDKFLKLPMPIIYRCFKEIDYMFKDLRGPLVDKHQKVKETAHWYIVNQASFDLDNYRSCLPSEAVYEICYCLKEKAGLMKYRPDQYKWNEFLKTMQSAQRLYKENELLADSALCSLNIMDEATAELNLNSEKKTIRLDTMKQSLSEVEKILPYLMEHPILNEIYLRLSLYCIAIGEIEKSKAYYRMFQELGNFSINHFAPWLRGKYSVISLYMLVIGYIEAVDRVSRKDISGERSQIQDWFAKFHERNGYFEAVVLGRVLGGDIIPLCLEMKSSGQNQDSFVNISDIQSVWLVIPAINTKIRCNATLSEENTSIDCIFSDWDNRELRYYNVNTLEPDVRSAIERIVEIIKAEMPDYLMKGEELNRLVADSWFDMEAVGNGL